MLWRPYPWVEWAGIALSSWRRCDAVVDLPAVLLAARDVCPISDRFAVIFSKRAKLQHAVGNDSRER